MNLFINYTILVDGSVLCGIIAGIVFFVAIVIAIEDHNNF